MVRISKTYASKRNDFRNEGHGFDACVSSPKQLGWPYKITGGLG